MSSAKGRFKITIFFNIFQEYVHIFFVAEIVMPFLAFKATSKEIFSFVFHGPGNSDIFTVRELRIA